MSNNTHWEGNFTQHIQWNKSFSNCSAILAGHSHIKPAKRASDFSLVITHIFLMW